jgi:hypothetical protein
VGSGVRRAGRPVLRGGPRRGRARPERVVVASTLVPIEAGRKSRSFRPRPASFCPETSRERSCTATRRRRTRARGCAASSRPSTGKRCLANGSTGPPRRRWRLYRTGGSATSSSCSPGARRGLGCAAAPPESELGVPPPAGSPLCYESPPNALPARPQDGGSAHSFSGCGATNSRPASYLEAAASIASSSVGHRREPILDVPPAVSEMTPNAVRAGIHPLVAAGVQGLHGDLEVAGHFRGGR